MNRSRFNRCGKTTASLSLVAALLLVVRAGASGPEPQVSGKALLEQAARAEIELRFDAAADRLYRLLVEQPRAPEAGAARLALGRLLALSGDPGAALAEFQAFRDLTPTDHPDRAAEIGVATTLTRRLRAAAGTAPYFKSPSAVAVKGIPAINDPTSLDVSASGAMLLVDSGNGFAFRIEGDTATPIAGMPEVSAGTFMPDGTIALAGKTGIVVGTGKAVVFVGTWAGRPHPLRKVRALAATSTGDLFVVDRDYDGLLRCKPSAATCAPWGPPGKLRTVKVGVSDLAYLLDDRQESVCVVDQGGRLVTTIGPVLGTTKLGDVVDIAVDAAYGVYLADRQTKRLLILTLRSGTGNAVTCESIGSVVLPAEGVSAIKNPGSFGVAPDGSIIATNRSTARLFKFQ